MTQQQIIQHWNNGLVGMQEVLAAAKEAGFNARFIHQGAGRARKLVLYKVGK